MSSMAAVKLFRNQLIRNVWRFKSSGQIYNFKPINVLLSSSKPTKNSLYLCDITTNVTYILFIIIFSL